MDIVRTGYHMPTLAQAGTAEYSFHIRSHAFCAPHPRVIVQNGGRDEMPNARKLYLNDQSPERAAQAMDQVGDVRLAPTATPFLGSGTEGLGVEQPGGLNLLLWSAVGLLPVAQAVAFILVVERQGHRSRRKA